MKFEAGAQVTPVVRLVRPLGAGGMGAVWVAEHTTLRTEVVVKFVSDALASDPVSLARFSREASAAAAVKSPHVVQMLDHGLMADGTPFIVMELLEGEDLRHRLAREKTIDLALLGTIISQACKALGRAHASGIVHRDVKPENIFLCHMGDGDTFVKLLDFGIARSGKASDFRVTTTGAILGTPFYMSPEQAVGEPVDSRSDLWSLGVVAFEAMTGTRPFQGVTLGALTIAICSDNPPVASRVNPNVPVAIDAWLATACARVPDRRFATAREMSDAFAAALASLGPLAFQATTPSRPLAPPARTPATPGLLELGTSPALARTHEAVPPPGRRGRALAMAGAIVGLMAIVGFVSTHRSGPSSPTAGASTASTSVSAGAPPSSASPPASTAPRASQPTGWVEIPRASAVPDPVPPPSASGPAVVSVRPVRPPAEHHAPPPAASCDPPYFFDAQRNKVFKPACLE